MNMDQYSEFTTVSNKTGMSECGINIKTQKNKNMRIRCLFRS